MGHLASLSYRWDGKVKLSAGGQDGFQDLVAAVWRALTPDRKEDSSKCGDVPQIGRNRGGFFVSLNSCC